MRGGKTETLVESLVGTIADALYRLAEERHGAIIVLPGKEPIQEWLAGGFVLDAEPSFPLLMSIFDPHSPGHDGALIVEKGRLSQFGVRLPISDTNKLPAVFGTRHHAAMGLSEKSDAMVLVVSEERGAVSLAIDLAKAGAGKQILADHGGKHPLARGGARHRYIPF
jgi:DNA integrity scanning protein DisA with diadenylate cyclase activity